MSKTEERTCILAIAPIADLGAICTPGELIAFNVGPDGVAYFVVAQKPLDYRRIAASGTSFAKTVPTRPQTYRVVGLSDSRTVLDVVIQAEKFNIHDVQPLGGSELLLVCGRSHYRSRDDFEKNGRVYSLDGSFVREILLGDGIRSVQTTAAGVIWTSFIDEGIFGNYGWRDPVGAPGLIAWDSNGQRLYEFAPRAGLESMCDCYALNVASESVVWCYYYRKFPLVRIRRHKIEGVWKCPVSGSDGFAISQELTLFRGAYKQHDDYQLFQLSGDGKVETIAKIEFSDEDGEKLIAEHIVARGSSLYVLRRSKLYQIDVATVANSIGL